MECNWRETENQGGSYISPLSDAMLPAVKTLNSTSSCFDDFKCHFCESVIPDPSSTEVRCFHTNPLSCLSHAAQV